MNFTNIFCIFFLVTIITYIDAACISDDFETTLDDEDLNLDNIEDTSNRHFNSKNLRYGSGSGSADGYEGSAFSGGGLSTESPNDKSRQYYQTEILKEIGAAGISDDFETTLDDEDLNLDNIEDTSNSHLNSKNLRYVCSNFCRSSGSGGGSADGYEGSAFSDKTNENITQILKKVNAMDEKINSLLAAVNSLTESSQNNAPLEYMKVYPVFLARSEEGFYKLTLEQAREKCIAKGAKLASLAQVKAAFLNGIDLCSCGWIEEGYAVFPTQYPRDGCFKDQHNNGPGVRTGCTWLSTWDAWCFSKHIANKMDYLDQIIT